MRRTERQELAYSARCDSVRSTTGHHARGDKSAVGEQVIGVLTDFRVLISLLVLLGLGVWVNSRADREIPLPQLEACLHDVRQAVRIERQITKRVRSHCAGSVEINRESNPCLTYKPRPRSQSNVCLFEYSCIETHLREKRETYPAIQQAQAQRDEQQRDYWVGREDERARLESEAGQNLMKAMERARSNSDRSKRIFYSKYGVSVAREAIDAARNAPQTRQIFERANTCAEEIL